MSCDRDRPRVIVALGGFAWSAALAWHRRRGGVVPRPQPRFGHGEEAVLAGPGTNTHAHVDGTEPDAQAGGSALPPVRLLGSYHVSQQNTQTGRLTRPMTDAVLRRAAVLAAFR